MQEYASSPWEKEWIDNSEVHRRDGPCKGLNNAEQSARSNYWITEVDNYNLNGPTKETLQGLNPLIWSKFIYK